MHEDFFLCKANSYEVEITVTLYIFTYNVLSETEKCFN